MREKAVRINASLPESLVETLKRRNETLGQPISWQIKTALNEWLARQENSADS